MSIRGTIFQTVHGLSGKIKAKNAFLTLIFTNKSIAELFHQLAELFESPRDLATVKNTPDTARTQILKREYHKSSWDIKGSPYILIT